MRPDGQETRRGDQLARLDLPMIELIHKVGECHRTLQTVLNDLADRWQIRGTELLVLWLCYSRAEAGMSQTALIRAIGVSPAQMSGLVERLRRRGLLSARRSSDDRRRQCWCLQPAGRQVLCEAHDELQRLADSCATTISPDSQQRLLALLELLAGTARDGHAPDRTGSGTKHSPGGKEVDDDHVYRRAS